MKSGYYEKTKDCKNIAASPSRFVRVGTGAKGMLPLAGAVLISLTLLATLCAAPLSHAASLHKRLWAFADYSMPGYSNDEDRSITPLRRQCLTSGAFDRYLDAWFADSSAFYADGKDTVKFPKSCGRREGTSEEYLEDKVNGFLYVFGDFSPCGCGTKAFVRAFPKKDGSFLLLKHYRTLCFGGEASEATEPLHTLLPRELTLELFLKKGETAAPGEFSDFIVRLQPPRTGQIVTARLEPLPLGMVQEPQIQPLRFSASYYDKSEARQDGPEFGVIDLRFTKNLLLYGGEPMERVMAQGHPELVTPQEFTAALIVSGAAFEYRRNDELEVLSSKEYSLESFYKKFTYMYNVYKGYSKLGHRAVYLKWEQSQGRFRVVGRGEPLVPLTFRQFLEKMDYWFGIC